MFAKIARQILSTRKKPIQMCGQLFSRYLNGVMLSQFDAAEIDWNGRRSCFLLSFDCDFPEDALALPVIAEMLSSRGLKASFRLRGSLGGGLPRTSLGSAFNRLRAVQSLVFPSGVGELPFPLCFLSR